MLRRRQAPGRDAHKHFSLAPARSHTNPPSNPQSAPAPSPLQVPGLKLAMMRRREHHTCHSSLSHPPPTPLSPSLLRPTPSPLPTLHPKHLKPRLGTDGEGRRSSAEGAVLSAAARAAPAA